MQQTHTVRPLQQHTWAVLPSLGLPVVDSPGLCEVSSVAPVWLVSEQLFAPFE